jgi:hypothetical protein
MTYNLKKIKGTNGFRWNKGMGAYVLYPKPYNRYVHINVELTKIDKDKVRVWAGEVDEDAYETTTVYDKIVKVNTTAELQKILNGIFGQY